MILSPSSSSSVTAEAVTGGGVVGFGLVSGGTLGDFSWGAGGGGSSSTSCYINEKKLGSYITFTTHREICNSN